MGARITGWASAVPPTVVTNADLEARLDTNDAWITERTGIRARHVGGVTSALTVESGRRAMAMAGVDPASVDLLVLSTTTPDQVVPATSSSVHHELGLSGAAFDLNAACAGFVYALVVADSLLGSGFRRALVIGSDALSAITDQQDRSTAVLFADGAGALVVEGGGPEPLLLAQDLGVDGSAARLIYSDRGGYMVMEGREVYRRAVRIVVESVGRVLEQAKVKLDDIAVFAPHQANLRIIEAVNARLGFPMEKTAVVLDRTGNTSSGSIPLALVAAAEQGRLRDGDLVLLSGFGAGMTWASAIARWGAPPGRPA